MKKIVINYPYVPHYRLPIFKKLSNIKKFNFEFWADESVNDPFFLTNTSGLKIKKMKTKYINISLLKHAIEWQPKAIIYMLTKPIDIFIIMANPYSPSAWLCTIIARTRGITALNWTHGYKKEEKGIKNFIRKYFYKLFTGHLLYGNHGREIMIKNGFPEKNLHVIYNSLDYEVQKSFRDRLTYQDRLNIRKKLGIEEDSMLLIAIGRILSKLKLDQAIQAIKKEIENGHNTYLLIIGDGYHKKKLEILTESLNIKNNIIFYGSCHAEEELSRLYNAADYSVVMGKVGLSAMHSLAYGIPMITNNNIDEHFPEVEAIINGETGWYFKEDDLNDFCSKLIPITYRGEHYFKCIKIIESFYNPTVQAKFIETAILHYTTK